MNRCLHGSRSLLAGFGVAALVATLGIPSVQAAPSAPSTPAAPAALEASGPYSARADASLVTLEVTALSPAVLPQTNLDLAHSTAEADSAADLDDVQGGNQRTASIAQTTGSTSLLGVDLGGVQTNSASAPENEIGANTAIPLDLDPVVDLPVITTSALANWAGDTECVADGTPLSASDQTLADLTLLALAVDQSIAELDLDEADGAADTQTGTFLTSIPGDNDPRAVQARAASTVTSANLLNGLAGPGAAISVDAVQTPNYLVSASGLPGGASVTGDQPVVNVTIAGQPLITIDDTNQTVDAVITDLVLGDLLELDGGSILVDLLTDLGLGALALLVQPIEAAVQDALAELQPIVRLSIPETIVEAADGTLASVDAALLRVEVLPPAAVGAAEPLADLLNQILGALGLNTNEPLLFTEIGPVSAQAVAPAGGIRCGDDSNPLELQKVNSGPAIPGSTFDYTIAVGNVGVCTMSPVRVVDTLLGPAGSTVTLTEPAGATVSPIDGGFRIEWADVGPIAPDGRTSLRIRVSVPTTAAQGDRYTDTVTATTTCDGREVTRTVTLHEPTVERAPSGPCNITGSTKGKSHLEVYPGESFIYFVNVYNAGGEACTGLTVTDAIDNRLTFESCSDGCTFTSPNALWNLGTVLPGQSLTLRLQVKVNLGATGELANAALIDTDQTDPTTVRVNGPLITTNSVLAPGDPAITPQRGLARTGGTAVLPWPVAVALGLLGLGAWHLRRRALA